MIAIAGIAMIPGGQGEPVAATPATGAPAALKSQLARREYLTHAADCHVQWIAADGDS